MYGYQKWNQTWFSGRQIQYNFEFPKALLSTTNIISLITSSQYSSVLIFENLDYQRNKLYTYHAGYFTKYAVQSVQ